MSILSRFRRKRNQIKADQNMSSSQATQPRPSVLSSPQPKLVSNPIPPPSAKSSDTSVLNRPHLSPLKKLKEEEGGDVNLGTKISSIGGDSDVLRLQKKVNSEDAPIRICIMNGKGGSGKSTLATNLATILSTHANSVTIIDNDPQASSIRWLKERPYTAIPIRGVTASEMTRLKNIQLWNSGIGPETKYVIIDTQAGLKGLELSDVIDRSDMIIIPVLPSAIDMRATADFVAQVFLSKAYRRTRKPIGVVANRVINDSIIYRKLQKFLLSLRMNFISTFSDNRAYLVAAEKGVGIFETNEPNTEGEKTEWDLLNQWVEDKRKTVLSVSGK